MKTILLCFAALALVGAKANANPITVAPGPEVHVSFSDLDLDSRAGRAAFEQRIRQAAETLCTIDGDRTADTALGGAGCYKAAVANGLQQMAKISQERLAQRQAATGAGH
jgi:UrcA family protein